MFDFVITTIWLNHATTSHQNQRISGAECGEPPRSVIFENLFLERCILEHISAKIQPKNLKLDHY